MSRSTAQVSPSPPPSDSSCGPVAIRVQGLRKRFRKYTTRGQYTTLKSSLVNRIFGTKPRHEHFLQVLDGIDLEVRRGQAVGIIGRNGSGKSTLLKLVARILKPDEGSVLVDGRISPLIELGAGFHPEFSGRENIFLNGIVLGMSRAEIDERFDTIVDFAELRDCIDDPVRTYSSGMYMRLGFAIAIHASPDVLLVDEILAVGDQAFTAKCQKWVEEFLARGKTILLVSHELSAIQRWCDDVVWLDAGRIRAQGAARDVIPGYLASFESGPGSTASDAGPRESWPAAIDGVWLVDESGGRRERFHCGEGFVLGVDYRVAGDNLGLALTVAVRKVDGGCGYGTSTATEGIVIPPTAGPARVQCRFRDVRLLGGSYVCDVWLQRGDGVILDQRVGCAPFRFDSGGAEAAVSRPDHDWEIGAGKSEA